MKYLTVAALAAVAGIAHAQFFDDFNRADAGTLGANWTNVVATTQVLGNHATNGASTLGLSTVNGFFAPYTMVSLSLDVTATQGATNYDALVFGYAGTNVNNAIFIKLQDNDGDGLFDHYGFYTGNNVSTGLSGFGTLSSTFGSGTMTVWASGADTVNLGIDTNNDNVFDQTYSSSGASFLSLGTQVGLGLYGNAYADNFRVNVVPEPLSCTVLGLGVLGLLRRRNRA